MISYAYEIICICPMIASYLISQIYAFIHSYMISPA